MIGTRDDQRLGTGRAQQRLVCFGLMVGIGTPSDDQRGPRLRGGSASYGLQAEERRHPHRGHLPGAEERLVEGGEHRGVEGLGDESHRVPNAISYERADGVGHCRGETQRVVRTGWSPVSG